MEETDHTEGHFFGGDWTEAKLQIVAEYAKAFQTALKNKQFETWYIDPFAGSGERAQKKITGDLLQRRPLEEEVVRFAGSARRALDITPHFNHYRFADTKEEHVDALRRLAEEHSARDIQVFPGDGNECVRKVLSNRFWTGAGTGWKQRGIVFLDPYGMDVSWETLRLIAKTKKLDVWFLFAAKAVRQQLGPNLESVDKGKADCLDRFFGEPAWRDAFFRPISVQMGFFGEESAATETTANLQAIGTYAQKRFSDAFCWVSEPKSLKVRNVPDYFQLYCMTNNPSQKAKDLIRKLHDGVIKAQG